MFTPRVRANGQLDTSTAQREYDMLVTAQRGGATTTQCLSGVIGLWSWGKYDGRVQVSLGQTIILMHLVAPCPSAQDQLRTCPEEKEFSRYLNYATCLLGAVKRMHACQIVHMDIKGDNFLYEGHERGIGNLIDFNSSGIVNSAQLDPRSGTVTPNFPVASSKI